MMLTGLQKNKKIGMVTPAGPLTLPEVQDAIEYLENLGYSLVEGRFVYTKNGLTAGTASERVDELHQLWETDEVSVIWGLRGGYGTVQLLEKLDYQLLINNPKLLIGFSDLTALQWALAEKVGHPMISGLTFTTQVGKSNPYTDLALEVVSGKKTEFTNKDFPLSEVKVHKSGSAKGILMGGTLTMICSLLGTPYWYNQDEIILFLEDVNEPLFRIDRCLQQLHLAGFWKKVRGIVLGQFVYGDKRLDIKPLLEPLIPAEIPIVENFPYGHIPDCCPLPVSVQATLETEPFVLKWQPFIF